MGLPWIRLDTSIFDHPKLLELFEQKAYQAVVVHLAAMTYSGKHGTDGYVPRAALPLLQGRPADADRLVKAELWRVDARGWLIHGWDERQVSDAEARARREKAQAAANARWGKK